MKERKKVPFMKHHVFRLCLYNVPLSLSNCPMNHLTGFSHEAGNVSLCFSSSSSPFGSSSFGFSSDFRFSSLGLSSFCDSSPAAAFSFAFASLASFCSLAACAAAAFFSMTGLVGTGNVTYRNNHIETIRTSDKSVISTSHYD